MGVPFVDLPAVNAPFADELAAEIAELIRTSAFINGPQVAEFEEAFARFSGTAACVGVASGADALRLALQAAGLAPGDEVVVPANTFVATFAAVVQAGGTLVVVDVSESDYNVAVDAVADAISPRTRFLLPVHLYGQLADMRALRMLAVAHELLIVEDACQAHGARRDGIRAGEAGLAAAFSFYPAKNLGAAGDAGAVVTNEPTLVDAMRALREHGQSRKNYYETMGYTARLDTLQAAVLLRKLPQLERWNNQRRLAAAYYKEAFDGVGDLRLPPVAAKSEHVWHIYAVRTADPEALGKFLEARGVASGRHYPMPAHLSPAYAWLGYREGDFPLTEELSRTLLSLPMFPGISEAQLDHVARTTREFFARG
jgi:dTDP-4-amino-4,6-dideoxygalactose transaminase